MKTKAAPPTQLVPPYEPRSFVKVFASPGIDSTPGEFGVIASGAAFPPVAGTYKTPPWDWANDAPEQGNEPGRLVGNFSATTAPVAADLKVRRRGLSPFGGSFQSPGNPHSQQHTGGIVDMNPGASFLIAGGPGAASSMVRLQSKIKKPNLGMKLPVLSNAVQRGGVVPLPAGGSADAGLAAPLMPKLTGWPTIFAFRNPAAATARVNK
jgi:hypothetical protein